MFENSIFKTEFSILLGLFPHHNLYRLTFQSFVLREYRFKYFFYSIRSYQVFKIAKFEF